MEGYSLRLTTYGNGRGKAVIGEWAGNTVFLGGEQQGITIFIEQKGNGYGVRFYSL